MNKIKLSVATCLLLIAGACGGVSKQPAVPEGGKVLRTMHGKASWYGGRHHGGPTASGEKFNKNAYTAAHRTLRFDSVVRVTNKNNGRQVVVRINDRGPFGRKERIIDVSEAAARKLGMIRSGVAPVKVELLEEPPPKKRKRRNRRRAQVGD